MTGRSGDKKRGKGGASSPEAAGQTSPKRPKHSSSAAGGVGGDSAAENPCIRDKTDAPRKASPPDGPSVRVMSFNVNGLVSFQKKYKGALQALVAKENVDVLFLQETKASPQKVEQEGLEHLLPGYEAIFNCSKVKSGGYAGTACFFRGAKGRAIKAKQSKMTAFLAGAGGGGGAGGGSSSSFSPISESEGGKSSALQVLSVTKGIGSPEHDDEGRAITLELDEMFLVNLYVPNSGQGLKRIDYRIQEWDVALRNYIASLEAKGKPCVVGGDLNVAHLDLDIYNVGAKHLAKMAGTTSRERDSFGEWLADFNMVDSFRHFHPEAKHNYTWWSVKTTAKPHNRGLRLDYFVCSKAMFSDSGKVRVHDCFHLDDVDMSDHCPIGIIIAM